MVEAKKTVDMLIVDVSIVLVVVEDVGRSRKRKGGRWTTGRRVHG